MEYVNINGIYLPVNVIDNDDKSFITTLGTVADVYEEAPVHDKSIEEYICFGPDSAGDLPISFRDRDAILFSSIDSMLETISKGNLDYCLPDKIDMINLIKSDYPVDIDVQEYLTDSTYKSIIDTRRTYHSAIYDVWYPFCMIKRDDYE